MAVKRQILDSSQCNYFYILNIECGNLLERTWGGSNEYPHSTFVGKIRKTMYQCDFLSFFLTILSRSILIIIIGVVGGSISNLAKEKNIRDGPFKLFTRS